MQSKLLFLVAILMALITTAIFFYSTQNEATETDEEEIPMVDVVVTTSAIQENQTITSEDVMLESVPEEQAHPSAIRTTEDAVGKFTTTTLESDEIVLQHRLKSDKDEQELISRKVQEGQRGVSIGTDMVRSVSNLIDPEDRVDIIFTYSEEEESEEDEEADSEIITELLLENVRVLAVGREMVSNSAGEEFAEYSSITLELTPEEAVGLVNSSERGTIHFTVHSRINQNDEEDDS
ncbi:Flp pilus assembly protein CpaB [Halalkalibacillus sediminis]|uniref:Flp pilus assembly protein CpaB n=1 Tax=Halalkalibacillus sediminis TaxID=2018042 RepID=A0A2I0QSF5_9BACI|nr:Flp pilus assembly protein CpaB [Halalkalibacillus sediminis]PKR77267.1 Flp pilus assembly protein CpaB [Halalkalibacillus sediminis]